MHGALPAPLFLLQDPRAQTRLHRPLRPRPAFANAHHSGQELPGGSRPHINTLFVTQSLVYQLYTIIQSHQICLLLLEHNGPMTHFFCLFFFLQFFQLEVYNSDGSRMTESQIHSQLLRIRSQSWKTDKEPMGILTSEHRHTWGQAYNRLLRGRS